MKRFSFRLEPLRALREQGEEQAKAALGRELTREADCRDAVRSAAERLAQAGARADGTGTDLMARQAFVERCERDLRVAELGLAEAGSRVCSKRRELVEASRERETLERLKDRRRGEHETHAQRLEDGLLSEVGLALHRRTA